MEDVRKAILAAAVVLLVVGITLGSTPSTVASDFPSAIFKDDPRWQFSGFLQLQAGTRLVVQWNGSWFAEVAILSSQAIQAYSGSSTSRLNATADAMARDTTLLVTIARAGAYALGVRFIVGNVPFSFSMKVSRVVFGYTWIGLTLAAAALGLLVPALRSPRRRVVRFGVAPPPSPETLQGSPPSSAPGVSPPAYQHATDPANPPPPAPSGAIVNPPARARSLGELLDLGTVLPCASCGRPIPQGAHACPFCLAPIPPRSPGPPRPT